MVNFTINFIHFQVRLTKEDRYFNDPFEALPKYGYTNFFEKLLLNNADIDVRLNMDYFEVNIIYQYGWTEQLFEEIVPLFLSDLVLYKFFYTGQRQITQT